MARPIRARRPNTTKNQNKNPSEAGATGRVVMKVVAVEVAVAKTSASISKSASNNAKTIKLKSIRSALRKKSVLPPNKSWRTWIKPISEVVAKTTKTRASALTATLVLLLNSSETKKAR